jgi:tetratricopeptide (TPR) repeat protein
MGNELTQLRRARAEAQWSQTQLIAAMRRAAPSLKIRLPDNESLKTNVTRWENGHVMPGPDYRKLLRVVYGMTDAELGFPTTETSGALLAVSTTDLSAEGLAYFGALLTEHIRADNLLGPQHVASLVEHQAHQLNVAARNARGTTRRDVLALAFRFHKFLGWLHQDSGHYVAAMTSTDRARDMATELGDPLWNAYLLMRKSNIATDADDPASAAALADAALAAVPGPPPKLHAVILRQKANAHAALGDIAECANAVDQSLRDLDRDASEWDANVSYCTEPYVAMEAASCWTQLGRPKRALEIFEQAEADWPGTLRRDKGLYLSRLAITHAELGDIDKACSLASDALAVANLTHSVRTLRELRRLRSDLARWRRRPDVQAVSTAVASLIGRAA